MTHTTRITLKAEEVKLGDLVHRIDGDIPLETPFEVDLAPEVDSTSKYVTVHMAGLGSPRYLKGTRFEVVPKNPGYPDGTVARGANTCDGVRVNGDWVNVKTGDQALWTDRDVRNNQFITVIFEPKP